MSDGRDCCLERRFSPHGLSFAVADLTKGEKSKPLSNSKYYWPISGDFETKILKMVSTNVSSII